MIQPAESARTESTNALAWAIAMESAAPNESDSGLLNAHCWASLNANESAKIFEKLAARLSVIDSESSSFLAKTREPIVVFNLRRKRIVLQLQFFRYKCFRQCAPINIWKRNQVRIEIANSELGGLKVTVYLPLQESA